MEYVIGLTLALAVSLGAAITGLDRERAFYTSVALAVGTYYILFAVVGGSAEALLQEVAAYAVLATVAILGFRKHDWLVVAALVGHGVFDIFHGGLIDNGGVPSYWPMFCMTYDVVAGLVLGFILYRRSTRSAAQRVMKLPSAA